MELTILMPCLNEERTIGICIKKAQSWIKKRQLNAEILVADNGSSDNSIKIAQNNNARVLNVKEKGYGAALYYGALNSKGKYIIMGDSDNSYDFSNLDFFYDKLLENYDFVIGNRFQGGIEKNAMPWKNKYLGNPILSFIGRFFFNTKIRDFHCGLRGCSKKAFKKMNLKSSGMEYATEMVIKSQILKLKTAEVPTKLYKDGRNRPPHLRPWQDGWRHLKFMLLYTPKWYFFIPWFFLFIVSILFYLIIFFDTLWIGNIGFDIHTLFYAQTVMIIAFSWLLLGITVRIHSARQGYLLENKILSKLNNSPVLEVGSILSFISIGIGITIGINLIGAWSDKNFSDLIYGEHLRTLSLSTSFILLGGIGFLFSSIMGYLMLPSRR